MTDNQINQLCNVVRILVDLGMPGNDLSDVLSDMLHKPHMIDAQDLLIKRIMG